MSPEARKKRAEGFPVPAVERTHVPVKAKDFLSILDFSHEELARVLDLAVELKDERAAGRRGSQPLAGRHVALLFERPSLRTRATFTIAIRELGGDVIELPADVVSGSRETVEDVARNLERWLNGAVIRASSQERLTRFAKSAPGLHVVNALTSEQHPSQALADMMTLRGRDARRARAHRVAGWLRTVAGGGRRGPRRRAPWRHGRGHQRHPSRSFRCRCDLHGRVGVDGPGK
jgi:ornithine carbamoyltransferase